MSAQKHADLPTRRTAQADSIFYDIGQACPVPRVVRSLGDVAPARICLRKILDRFRTGYRLARQRYRQRKQLMEMDYRQLKDIGITREEAEQEARKPIWKD